MEDKATNIHVLELSQYTRPEITEDSKEDWVNYGEDNLYYDWLIDRYKGSVTNNSIINNINRLTYGRGLHATDAASKPMQYAKMKVLIKPEVLKAVAKNLKILGSGIFQVIYNKQHTEIEKVLAVKTKLVRTAKCNKDGEIDAYYYSDNWGDVKKFTPKRIPAFGTSKERIELLIVGDESIDLKYYNEVDYQAALPYCLLEEEIADYLINDTQNGFSGTKVINFNNGVPDERQQEAISKKVKGQLTGSMGDKVIIAFNNNQESKTTVDDIPLNDAPEHYAFLSKECQGKILNNHNVVSSFIVGINPEGQGFSSSADEIETATKYFYNQSVKPLQDLLIEAIDKILAFNNISLDLYFKRLNLLDSIEEKEQQEQETELSVKFSHWLDEFGEEESEDWELIDAREVDYELEDEFDNQLLSMEQELKGKKPNLLQKVVKFATGIASPNRPSEQDREIDGFYFKVRYKYTGNPSPERGFCREMMRASKVYRKEDIIRMGTQAVNRGFGEFGADTYSIWLYKGGPRCHHKWQRRTYVSATKNASIGSAKTNEISTNKARKFGYRINNEKEVSMKPNDMPLKGFSPNNTNLPNDVK